MKKQPKREDTSDFDFEEEDGYDYDEYGNLLHTPKDEED